jgi:hypothetical protein
MRHIYQSKKPIATTGKETVALFDHICQRNAFVNIHVAVVYEVVNKVIELMRRRRYVWHVACMGAKRNN